MDPKLNKQKKEKKMQVYPENLKEDNNSLVEYYSQDMNIELSHIVDRHFQMYEVKTNTTK